MCLNIAAWLDDPRYPGFGYGLRLGLNDGDSSDEPRLQNTISNSNAVQASMKLTFVLDSFPLEGRSPVDANTLASAAPRANWQLMVAC
jgi:hypothetical protein